MNRLSLSWRRSLAYRNQAVADELIECVCDHFMGLALKGLKDSLIDYLFYDEDPYHIETRPLPTNCSSVFDHFVGLVFKGLKESLID